MATKINIETDDLSPFVETDVTALSSDKFQNPDVTAKGEPRASVAMTQFDTIWFNTGTLCNLACKNCYIESSPKNDALVYISLDEVRTYLDEITQKNLTIKEIAFTGGEPFMNPDMIAITQLCLDRGYKVLILSNAMRPMRRFEKQLLELPHRDSLTFRVSLDHFTKAIHEEERGPNSWDKAIAGLQWLAANGFNLAIAGRHLPGEDNAAAMQGYANLFAENELPLDAANPAHLMLFPEMDARADVAEITTSCWGILDVNPADIMCASSRMVVKRKGEATPRVAACTLLPYDPQFDMGATLEESMQDVKLNHPHCARFCVLGGASCTA